MSPSRTLISSRDNPRLKSLHALAHSGRERRKTGLSLLDGEHLVEAALTAGCKLDCLVVSEEAEARPGLAVLLRQAGDCPRLVLKEALFAYVSPVDSPSGILAVFAVPPAPARALGADSVVVLEGVQDAGNLGTILRTAAAAGVPQVVLSPGCAQAWSPRVLRAGMGAHFHLEIFEQAAPLAVLADFPGQVLATALGPGERDLFDVDLRGPTAWLFGAEGQGLSPELLARADVRIRIPMPGAVESLNVGSAAAICVYEQLRQRRLAGAAGSN